MARLAKTFLADSHPDLLAEWNYAQNTRDPAAVATHSRYEAAWTCPRCEYQWESRICNRTRTNRRGGCPACTGRAVTIQNSLAARYPALAKEWHPTKNELSPEQVTRGSNKKVWWRCEHDHEWMATILSRTCNGNGCQACARIRQGRPQKAEDSILHRFPAIVKEWDYERNDLLPKEFLPGSSVYAWWICSSCSHKWSTRIVTRTSGYGCPKCARLKQTRPRTPQESLAYLFPALAAEWDYEKNEGRPEEYTRGSVCLAWWLCPPRGHSWKATIQNRCNGGGCRQCYLLYGIKPKSFEESFAYLFPTVASEWDYAKNKIPPERITPGSEFKAWWTCGKCRLWWQAIVTSRAGGRGCPYCCHKRWSDVRGVYYSLLNFSDLVGLNGQEKEIKFRELNLKKSLGIGRSVIEAVVDNKLTEADLLSFLDRTSSDTIKKIIAEHDPEKYGKRLPVPAELKRLIMERDGHTCKCCSATEELQYDHIVPWSKGGKTSAENLQLLCQTCNLLKGNKTLSLAELRSLLFS